MANDKLYTILMKFLEASRAGKIEWIKNLKSDEAFNFKANDMTVTVAKVSTATYFIVTNLQGIEIGRQHSGQPAYQAPILELYKLARRKVLKIDESLDNLDKFIDDILK
jgi:hypothetical protein